MRRSLFAWVRLVSLCLLLSAARLSAQQAPPPSPAEPEDPASKARMRIGPFYMSPSLTIKNVGFDNNVFNQLGERKTDFTATIGSQLSAGARLGRARLTASTGMDLVFYKTYRDQGSMNRRLGVRLEAPLNRFFPFVAVESLQTRDRPNNEIDLRARRTYRSVSAGVGLPFSSRTEVVLGAQHREVGFLEGERFRGVELREVLDETIGSASASLRMVLTPLTTLFLRAEVQQDRFTVTTGRDADSMRIAPGLEFKPAALLEGGLEVGYRRFSPRGADLPEYRGVVAAVGLGYTLLGVTKFELRLTRDVTYSFELLEPYYLSTGGRLTVTQRLIGPVDLLAVASQERLDYVALESAAIDPRVDTARSVSTGIGIRATERVRFDLLAEFTERRSTVARGRPYDGRRLFSSLSVAM